MKKVSVSLDEDNLQWLKDASKRLNRNVSWLLGQAVERMRREDARDEVIAYLGDTADMTDEEAKAIEDEWKR